MITIYFDMDGVLVDLDHELERIDPEYHAIDCRQMIRDNLHTDLFINAPPMPEFAELKKFMSLLCKTYTVEILSSCMEAESFDEIKRQKNVWLKNWGLDGYKRNFSVGGKQKAFWANDRSVLIDDTLSNVISFVQEGGQAVHYTGFQKARMDLLKILKG